MLPLAPSKLACFTAAIEDSILSCYMCGIIDKCIFYQTFLFFNINNNICILGNQKNKKINKIVTWGESILTGTIFFFMMIFPYCTKVIEGAFTYSNSIRGLLDEQHSKLELTDNGT